MTFRNTGFVNVGTDHDTGAFAVHPFADGGTQEGRPIYPDARTILITADGGGSNGWRLRLWKFELQKFRRPKRASLASVCHFPPGTSKWRRQDRTPPLFFHLFELARRTFTGLRNDSVQLIAKTTTAQDSK